MRLLTELLPYQAADAAAAVAAALGVLLLYLAGGLRRRKHRAWVAAVVVTAVVGLSHLAKGLDVEEATASAVVLTLLLGCRSEFEAEADPGGRRLAVRRFVQLVLLGTALGMLLLQAYSAQLVGRPSLRTQAHEVLLGLIGVTGPVGFASDRTGGPGRLDAARLRAAHRVRDGVLRAAAGRARGRRWTRATRSGCAACSTKHGRRDSLGYFALRRDKSVIWSPSGKAAIAYRVVHGVMLASGDPIGDPEAWPGAIEAVAAARPARHAWMPAVMGCSELGGDGLGPARPRRARARRRGDRRDGRTSAWTGGAMRERPAGVSTGCKRTGYTVRIRRMRDIPPDEMAEPGAAADAWRGGGDRARLLDGARPARRPGRRRLRAGQRPDGGRRRSARLLQLRAVGPGRAVPRPDAPGPRTPTTG